ncbi:MAG: hypothetical protein JOY69_10590 [Candidatus Eremiobacteraeota bacterium]|nr:hypothetical protein [Candidatus Eremiobacteraeota bacterium]
MRSAILPHDLDPFRDAANFFETMGVFVKLGIVDRAIICELFDGVVFGWWKQLEPIILIRREFGDRGLWTNFEYLAVICEESLSKTQGDYYPRGTRRMRVDERSLEAVAQFAKEQTGAPPSTL